MRDILEIMGSHRSIRKYSNRPVEPALLTKILDAARQAPSSSNLQSYSILVIRDSEKKKLLSQYCGNQTWVAQCPVFLVMCPDLHRLNEVCLQRGYKFQDRYLEITLVSVIDTSLVAQNIAIAAEAEGMGICMIGGIRNNPDKVCDLLKLPKRVFPLMGICLGYPDQEPMIKPRLPHDVAVHYEQYRDGGLENQLIEYDRLIKSTGLYDGSHRKVAAPDGRDLPDSEYSWSEHSARRAASSNPVTLRAHMYNFLKDQLIGLE